MKIILVGDTLQLTWISSGVAPSDIHAATYNGTETLVNSASMSSSGNGHYYAFVSVNTSGFYVSEMVATVNGNPYKRRIKFNATTGEVD